MLFVLRHYVHGAAAHQWGRYLDQPWMCVARVESPSLYRKIIRPYVSTAWTDSGKVSAMIHHYEFLRHRLKPECFAKIISPAGVDLGSVPIGKGDTVTLRLRYDSKFRKEGETTLELLSAKYQCRVGSMSFVIVANQAGRPGLIIAAVFGLPMGVDKNIIKDTAKAMYGLRPKALLLIVIQELASQWGIHALFGVGSRVHTSRDFAYALNASRQFEIAYDEFWHEAGGVRRSDGLYQLPLVFNERSETKIVAHKRAVYRQRYAWIRQQQEEWRGRLFEWKQSDGLGEARSKSALSGPGPSEKRHSGEPEIVLTG